METFQKIFLDTATRLGKRKIIDTADAYVRIQNFLVSKGYDKNILISCIPEKALCKIHSTSGSERIFLKSLEEELSACMGGERWRIIFGHK